MGERVSVVVLLWLCSSNILEISFQHLKYNLRIAAEQQRVFCNKEITALLTEPRNIDAAAASGELAVLHDHTLVAGRRKAVMYQVGEGTFQVEYRCTLLHHIGDYVTTG